MDSELLSQLNLSLGVLPVPGRFDAAALAALPRLWLDASIACLQQSGFITAPTLTALQTICLLPMVAHAHG
jgi:hypothetical protein